MRNDSHKWDAPPAQRPPLIRNNLTIRPIALHRQTLLGGPIKTCLQRAKQTKATGWPEPASGDSYALRLRRDRILLVNGPDLPDGWHPDGIAISDMTHGYACIELSGKDALSLLNQATGLDPATPSNSCMRLFHGWPCLIYKWQTGSFRLHIEHPHTEPLWQTLIPFSQNIPR
jgi:hypothetical protein